jgi:hypothetical protein
MAAKSVHASSDRLTGVSEKIKRARHHRRELADAIAAFYRERPYVAQQIRDDGRFRIFRAASVGSAPPDISILLGEGVHSLRSALDHLAFQLAIVGNGGALPPKPKKVYFPIGNDQPNYESRRADPASQGVSAGALNKIDALEPWHDGKGNLFWIIQEINNIDKHRVVLTAAAALHSIHHIVETPQELLKVHPGFPPVWALQIMSRTTQPQRFIQQRPKFKFPVEPGDEFRVPLTHGRHPPEIHLDLAFNEAGVLEGAPLLATVDKMIESVEGLLPTFEPFL